MKQRLKPYNKRKPFKMKKGGAKYMLHSKEARFGGFKSPETKASNTIANFIDLLFRPREISPNIRSNIKQENKEITKES